MIINFINYKEYSSVGFELCKKRAATLSYFMQCQTWHILLSVVYGPIVSGDYFHMHQAQISNPPVATET